ncbi:effector-associated constant component EACC1 [Nocardia jiangxiensis]|uniref:effector-associated constant component EACC1 n=1 Tax=Nocardia jiangxiensis TaxID=282685 RepID=UPI000595027A|nr:hypothetical protein [Nocardia jiangxiensis]
MDIAVTLAGTSTDELHSLYRDLGREFELRGRVSMTDRPPASGTLGGVADMLIVALGPSGVGAVLATALVAWVRNRSTDVVCKLSRPDGSSAELSAKQLRGCDAAALQQVVRDLAVAMEAPAVSETTAE